MKLENCMYFTSDQSVRGAVLTVCIVRFLTDDIIIDKSRSFPYPSHWILICYAADDFWLVLMLFTQMPVPTIFNT